MIQTILHCAFLVALSTAIGAMCLDYENVARVGATAVLIIVVISSFELLRGGR